MAAAENVFAFLGNDSTRVKEAALGLAKQLAPGDDEFALETVNGAAENSDHAAQILGQVREGLLTLPFFGGNKVVWLQDANFLGDSVVGRAQATLDGVEDLAELLESGLPAEVSFILSASEIDKRRSFFKRLKKCAEIEIFDKIDTGRPGWEQRVMDLALERAEPLGLHFASGALDRLVHLTGADTGQLQSELEKLDLFLGPERREVSHEDVGAIVTPTHTGVIFEIGDALAKRDLALTLELIDRQLRAGENPIGLLLAAIVPRVRALLQARDLIERHRLKVGNNFKAFERDVQNLPEEEIAHLPRKKDGNVSCYPIFLAAGASRKFQTGELLEALEACLEANLKLISTQLDPQLVLTQLVTRILGRRPEGLSAT